MPTQTTKLLLPTGIAAMWLDGQKFTPNASGMISVPTNHVSAATAAGCMAPPSADTTANRPKLNLSPGQFYFDATLNKPIWRNAANTGWVDATGTAA